MYQIKIKETDIVEDEFKTLEEATEALHDMIMFDYQDSDEDIRYWEFAEQYEIYDTKKKVYLWVKPLLKKYYSKVNIL